MSGLTKILGFCPKTPLASLSGGPTRGVLFAEMLRDVYRRVVVNEAQNPRTMQRPTVTLRVEGGVSIQSQDGFASAARFARSAPVARILAWPASSSYSRRSC